MCRLAAFADRPHDQRLSAPHIARRKDLRYRGLIRDGVGGHVAALIEGNVEGFQHSFMHRMHEAHGEENEIGLDLEFRAGHRLELRINVRAMKFFHLAFLAGEFLRQHGELPRDAFLVARRNAQFEWPIRPGEHFILLLGRLRHDLEIGDGFRALADRSADAVRAGITATDNHNFFAGREDWLAADLRFIAYAPVLLRQEIHCEVNAGKLAAGNGQVAWRFAAAGEHNGVVLPVQFVDRDGDSDMRVVVEDDAFALHLLDAAVDVDLLHLEIGNAVAKQPACLRPALVDMHVVAGTRELLRAGEPRRTWADDRNLLAGLALRFVGLESLLDRTIGDFAFDRFDGDRVLVDVECTGCFARGWTDAPGHFREVVRRMQIARRFFPVAAIDEVVP